MMEQELKLLPCPFCGGEAHLGTSQFGYYVECMKCDACGAYGRGDILTKSMPDAIKLWNTRTDDQTARIAELEALHATMEALYMDQRIRAEKAKVTITTLLEALEPCEEAIADYINALECQGWTRHRDAEISDAHALFAKVQAALAMTGKDKE